MAVGSVTTNFQSESPLSEAAASALSMAASQGWVDPNKLPSPSRSAKILLEEARSTFATHLNLRPESIYFLGEVSFGYYLGLAGLLSDSRKLYYAPIDRQEVHAIAAHNQSEMLSVNPLGKISTPPSNENNVINWQLLNGETGIAQDALNDSKSFIFVDATTSGARLPLPKHFSTALFDSRSWDGPQGLGILVINDEKNWHNPIPRMDNAKVPGGASLPLIISSAIALDQWVDEEAKCKTFMAELAAKIRNFATSEIGDVTLVGGSHDLVAISIHKVDAEYLVQELDKAGFAVDSGSACKPTALAPSHVLEAMGQPTEGNLRIYLHHTTTEVEVDRFLVALKYLVEKFRS
jgi:cysteine desulfurase